MQPLGWSSTSITTSSGFTLNLLRRSWRFLTRSRASAELEAQIPSPTEAEARPDESPLPWVLDHAASADPVQRVSGIAGAAAYGVAAIGPLLERASDPSYIPTAVDILMRIAARGDKAAVLDALFRVYPQAEPDDQQRIIGLVGSLQTSAPPPTHRGVDGQRASVVAGTPTTPTRQPSRPTPGPALPIARPRRVAAADPLADAIESVLTSAGRPLRARVISHELVRFGHPNTDRRTVNRMLYSKLERFVQNSNWEWWPVSAVTPASAASESDASIAEILQEVAPAPSSPTPFQPIATDSRLYRWQEEALEAWSAADHRGIVQAITGSGKTRVGLAAIQRHLDHPGGRVAVIVPTVVLLNQWRKEIAIWLGINESDIGQCGGGGNDDLTDARITVYVVNSAAQYLTSDAGAVGRSVLLVADECHRYGAEGFRAAIQGPFEATLGLSATPSARSTWAWRRRSSQPSGRSSTATTTSRPSETVSSASSTWRSSAWPSLPKRPPSTKCWTRM